MNWGQGVADLAKRVADYHRELVTTSVRFEELRRQTIETLSEFKNALERINGRLQDIERRSFESQTTMNAKADMLVERMNNLSEKALHKVMEDVARQKLTETLSDVSPGVRFKDGSRTSTPKLSYDEPKDK